MTRDDPFAILGVDANATPEEIRASYLRLVAVHPPDRDPAGFTRLRDAFALLKDPRARARARLFGPTPLSSLAELVDLLRPTARVPVGAKPWLEALGEARPTGATGS